MLFLWQMEKIVEQGTPYEIFDHPQNTRTKEFLKRFT